MSSPKDTQFAIHGTLIHSKSSAEIEILEATLVIVSKEGQIIHILPATAAASIPSIFNDLSLPPTLPVHRLNSPSQFLIPGLIDTHVHAPQWSMRGLGQGLHILDWLDQITFPHEARFKDASYARSVYEQCVDAGLRQGITTACYFTSIHEEASKVLANVCLEKGQRAFIGKTCMDHQDTNPVYYREESTEASIASTSAIISHCTQIDPSGTYVQPILTPRFAISCTPACLSALGSLTSQHRLRVQTHFCEAEQEIAATLRQYPEFKSEVDLYRHYGLLTERSVLAHCTIVSDDEVRELKDIGCGVAHCPIANTTVGGGFMAAPVRKMLDMGIKVGLGTDSGGGYSSSILDAMRHALVVGNAREMLSRGKEKTLGIEEVFYMATLGGAKVLSVDGSVGRFEVGKTFDAVLVDMRKELGGVNTMFEEGDSARVVFEKFVMTGDDRNLREVWVQGQKKKK